MTREEAEQHVADLVRHYQGIKAFELAAKVPSEVIEHNFGDVVESCIKKKMITEVAYMLPGGVNFRAKSFLLPPGTKITIAPAD